MTYPHTIQLENGHYVVLTLTEISKDQGRLQTTLSYSVIFYSGSSYGYQYRLNNYLWLTIDGTIFYNDDLIGEIVLNAGESKELASGTIRVQHNQQGQKNLTSYLRFQQPYGPYNSSGTFTDELTMISTGIVYIGNGSNFDQYQIYISNGSSWEQYQAYINNGSSWEQY